MNHSPSYLSREHMNPKLTCSQRQWLHSSVGRASHRYREVTGSSPVEVLHASLRNCKNCDHNCEDHSSFDLVIIDIVNKFKNSHSSRVTWSEAILKAIKDVKFFKKSRQSNVKDLRKKKNLRKTGKNGNRPIIRKKRRVTRVTRENSRSLLWYTASKGI